MLTRRAKAYSSLYLSVAYMPGLEYLYRPTYYRLMLYGCCRRRSGYSWLFVPVHVQRTTLCEVSATWRHSTWTRYVKCIETMTEAQPCGCLDDNSLPAACYACPAGNNSRPKLCAFADTVEMKCVCFALIFHSIRRQLWRVTTEIN